MRHTLPPNSCAFAFDRLFAVIAYITSPRTASHHISLRCAAVAAVWRRGLRNRAVLSLSDRALAYTRRWWAVRGLRDSFWQRWVEEARCQLSATVSILSSGAAKGSDCINQRLLAGDFVPVNSHVQVWEPLDAASFSPSLPALGGGCLVTHHPLLLRMLCGRRGRLFLLVQDSGASLCLVRCIRVCVRVTSGAVRSSPNSQTVDGAPHLVSALLQTRDLPFCVHPTTSHGLTTLITRL